MDKKKKTIFACFAHPDDELSCLGTLVNHVDNGDKVILAWTTSGEMASFFDGMSFDQVKDIREEQGKKIGAIIDCETLFMDHKDTSVFSTRENALKMAKLIAQLKPDAIVTWNQTNSHPDHRGTVNLLYDALTYARLPRITDPEPPHRPRYHVPMFLYYDSNSPLRVVHVDITKNFDKVRSGYQLYAEFYGWGMGDWLDVRRRSNGMECGVQYAEKFNVLSRYAPAEQLLPINNK